MSLFGSKKPDPPIQPASHNALPSSQSRQSVAAPSPRPAAAANSRTHIASGSKVVGKVTGDAELVIDGHLDGQVELKSRVVVGAKGRVEGTVRAVSVQLAGKVVGNVQGEERVEVLPSGSLEGDVTSPRVMISDGAFFKGKVEMTAPKPISTHGASEAAAQSATRSAPDPARHAPAPEDQDPKQDAAESKAAAGDAAPAAAGDASGGGAPTPQKSGGYTGGGSGGGSGGGKHGRRHGGS